MKNAEQQKWEHQMITLGKFYRKIAKTKTRRNDHNVVKVCSV